MTLEPYDDLRQLYHDFGLPLAPGVTDLYPHQREAVEWALTRPEPYLFVNAPTGSGKTLINTTVGVAANTTWTYSVHTKMLQNQVSTTFQDVPVFMGRSNFDCLIGAETHPLSPGVVTAADAICAMPGYEKGDCDHDAGALMEDRCGYYLQAMRAMGSKGRVVNYALLLNYPPLVRYSPHMPTWMKATRLLLCDEAHNIEQAVCDAVSVELSDRTFKRMGLKVPRYKDILEYAAWAADVNTGWSGPADRGYVSAQGAIAILAGIKEESAGEWMIEETQYGVKFQPVWGANFVMSRLMGHQAAPAAGSLYAPTLTTGIGKSLFTSATLMGAEYVAETLGLPDGSWAYLDMPSVFPVEHRPINYAPVMKMNRAAMDEPASRAKMQAAIDDVVEYYLVNGAGTGVIHAVSNRYRDNILTESRWGAIMVSTPEEHEARIADGQPSVLVAANLTEGWDGKDGLCRFVIMPKVPFPSLGDRRTRLRMEEDARSYDYRTLVAVVQGAGRGVRHREDYADTWILDESWRMLYAKRKDWLPQSFRDAYHHHTQLPSI